MLYDPDDPEKIRPARRTPGSLSEGFKVTGPTSLIPRPSELHHHTYYLIIVDRRPRLQHSLTPMHFAALSLILH